MNKPPSRSNSSDAVVYSLLFCAYFALIVFSLWQGAHSPDKAMYTLDTRLTPTALFGLLVLVDWAGLAYYNGRLGRKTHQKIQLALPLTLILCAAIRWIRALFFEPPYDLTLLSAVVALVLYLLTMVLYAPVLGLLMLLPAVRTAAQGGLYNLGLYALVGLICTLVCVVCYSAGRKSAKKRVTGPVFPEQEPAKGGPPAA